MKILVVDDESVARAMLVQVLGQLGYQVVESSSAVEALKIIQQNSISIVITDWMMPEIDGIELCRQIRSVNKQHYTYIIMLTSKDSREDKLEGLQSGVDDLLTKPLDRGELLARLEVAKRIIRMETTLRQNAEQLITSKKQLESLSILLEQSSRRFEDLFDGIPVACFTTDNEGCVYEWNQACERLYGHSGDQVLSRVIWDFICAPEHKRAYKKFHKKVFSGQTVDEYERIDIGAGGIKRNILSQMIPLRGYDQSIVGAIVANVDITDRKKSEQRILEEMMRANQYSKELEKNKKELEKANSQLSELAITDGLTGLYNHRSMLQKFDEVISSHPESTDLSAILLDIDHFKSYNDTFGHPAGDKVLKQVAIVLRKNARQTDIVARYGGEEFMIILPNTNAKEAVAVADRFRFAIQEADWEHTSVTASFGVATLSPKIKTRAELIDSADKALYNSKRTGRNRVSHIDGYTVHAA